MRSMGAIAWRERVVFEDDKSAKADLWRGERLFAGLNCFGPGQVQAIHVHDRADKLYLVLEGRGTFEVGAERITAGSGQLVPVPAGVSHGVRNDGSEPLVVLTVLAPPPEKRP